MKKKRIQRALPRPSNVDEVIFEIESEPDRYGRQSFSRYWLTDYAPDMPHGMLSNDDGYVIRSQCFHANVSEHVESAKADGKSVIVRNVFHR